MTKLDDRIADHRRRHDALETGIRERGGFTTDEGIARLALGRERQELTRLVNEARCLVIASLHLDEAARAACSYSRTVVFRREEDGWTCDMDIGFRSGARVHRNGGARFDLLEAALDALRDQIGHADLDGIAYAPSVDFEGRPDGQPPIPMRWTGKLWERVPPSETP